MKRRDCMVVIEKMMEFIPKEKKELIKDLLWNHDDASYKAPEQQIQWERTRETLVKHIKEPKEDWEFKVLNEFTMIPIDELKQMTYK